MPELTSPTPEQAEHILREVGVHEEFTGLKMSAMGGSSPSKLYSLASTASFLNAGTYEETMRTTNKATIGYVDLNLLVKWVTEVFGDTELAAAIQEEIDTGKAFGYVARPIKALLRERVEQCEAALIQTGVTA